MLYLVLQVITLLTAALMVGNELTVAVFLHPTLRRLPDGASASVRREFAALFGRVMPFWYAVVLLLTAGETWVGPAISSTAGKLLLASSLLWLFAIIFSVTLPAPLNSRIAKWDLQSLPATWQSDARRWDRMHVFRMAILLLALLCLTVGTVIS